MAGGLVGLLDDVAALAKLAAASLDDVGAAAGRASVKAAGVVIDDTAVTPQYVRGLAAKRELPIIGRIAKGSLRNKLFFILPVALLLSSIAPKVVEAILVMGGCYLCYEGAHKVIHRLRHDDHDHDEPSAELGPDAEAKTIAGAIRTDFILSAEIMVIALKEVLHEPLVSRAAILTVVAVAITIGVYGVVAMIVKMDDVGLALAERKSPASQRIGRTLVTAMPKVLSWLAVIGTAAMLWVGGHIVLAGAAELGWAAPYNLVHHLETAVHGVSGVGGVLGWVVNTLVSALLGMIIGTILVFIVERLPKRRPKGEHDATSAAAH